MALRGCGISKLIERTKIVAQQRHWASPKGLFVIDEQRQEINLGKIEYIYFDNFLLVMLIKINGVSL